MNKFTNTIKKQDLFNGLVKIMYQKHVDLHLHCLKWQNYKLLYLNCKNTVYIEPLIESALKFVCLKLQCDVKKSQLGAICQPCIPLGNGNLKFQSLDYFLVYFCKILTKLQTYICETHWARHVHGPIYRLKKTLVKK